MGDYTADRLRVTIRGNDFHLLPDELTLNVATDKESALYTIDRPLGSIHAMRVSSRTDNEIVFVPDEGRELNVTHHPIMLCSPLNTPRSGIIFLPPFDEV